MGSLKRKNASFPLPATSSKRASRDDSSAAAANGYTGRRAAQSPSSSSSSAAAAAPEPEPEPAPLSNGTPAENTIDDPPSSLPSSCSPHSEKKPSLQENPKIAEKETLFPADIQEQEADATACLESSTSKNLRPLMPNHAGWFSWSSIHAVERRGLPEFFNSKSKLKTPTLYMEYRNLLMKKYLENPEKLFTLADVSTAISDHKEGHIEAAKHIFEFLDHWGLLNSRALANAERDKLAKPKTSVVEGTTSGQPQGSLTSILYHFDSPYASSLSKTSSVFEKAVPATAMTETAATDLQGGVHEMAVEYHCNSCSADCSKRRFHCQKQADFDLCPECYNEGKFSFGITNTDFIIMEAVTDANDSNGWSDQETLLLLEALELYGDNFSEIAEHVGTKTKAQCILHFIRLPIEDPFLEAMELNNTSNVQHLSDPISGSISFNLAGQGDDQDEASKNQVNDMVRQKVLDDNTLVSGDANHVEPLGDGDLEDKGSSATNAIIAAAQAAGLVGSDKSIAFSECGNPVMALVAFLAALVTPDVAATSAQTALKLLANQASALQLADENSFNLEAEPPRNDTTSIQTDDGALEGDVQLESQPDTKKVSDVDGHKNTCADEGNTCPDSIASLRKNSSLAKVKSGAATALAAAAVKAKFLADREEWEILQLVAFVIDSQTKKVETKLRLFRELDAVLEKEHNLLERSRQRLFAERSQMAAIRAIQSASSSQYRGLNTAVAAGSGLSHSMSRLSSGFASVPPVPTGPFGASEPNDSLRGLIIPQFKDSQGVNMTPIRPVSFNSTPQFVYPSEIRRFTYGL